VRRHPVQIQPYKTSVDTAGDNALMLRFETADATINATLSIRMMQQLHEQIGQFIETRKITRAWGGQLNANPGPDGSRDEVIVEEEFAPGVGTASK
jgi:hypothetical protein